jgi:hypothetical protein
MSNKRQKVEGDLWNNHPCINFIEDALGLYLIDDIIGIILKTFMPFYHSTTWSQGELSLEVLYPCTADCLVNRGTSIVYKVGRSAFIGPYPLHSCNFEIAYLGGQPSPQRVLEFGSVPFNGVRMTQSKDATEMRLFNRGSVMSSATAGVAALFNNVMGFLMDISARDGLVEFLLSGPSDSERF